MKNKEKIKLLEQILHDFNNSYTWEFGKKIKRSITILKDIENGRTKIE